MNIALVIPEFSKLGGTERCVVSLGEALAARGHELTIVSGRRQAACLPGATWYRVPMIPRPHAAQFLSFLVGNTLVRGWLRLVRSKRFDIVQSTGPDVLRPTVTTLHCCGAALAERVRRDRASEWKRWSRLRRLGNVAAYRLVSLCERYVLRRGATRVIAVSQTLVNEVRVHHGVPLDRLLVVPDGVDPGEFHGGTRAHRERQRRALSIAADALVVLFVGHNWERKGLDTVVRALELARRRQRPLRPVLVVVGQGGRPAYAEALRKTLDGDVKFLGVQSAMGPIYGMADVCVLPSAYESFGLPVLEAMACGVPVIVSECAGVAEVITDGHDGVLLKDPGDIDELSGKLEVLLHDVDLRRRVGDHAARTAARYSWDRIAETMEGIYRGALAERRAVRRAGGSAS